MNRYNLAVLSEAKAEYTNQLVNVIYPEIYVGIKSIYDAAYLYCNKNNDQSVLKKFQYLLSVIPKWNTDKINDEYRRILKNTDCDWLEDLITAVFVSHTKVLASIKNSKKSRPINLDIPSGSYFLHKCYIECARNFWKKPYLVHREYSPIDLQRNLSDSEKIIKNSIIEAVRKMLPVKHILKEYLGDDYNDTNCNTDDITSTISNNTKNNLRKLVKSEIEQNLSFNNIKKNETNDNFSRMEINDNYIESESDQLGGMVNDLKKKESENKSNSDNKLNSEKDKIMPIEKSNDLELKNLNNNAVNIENKEVNWVPEKNKMCYIYSSSNGGWVIGLVQKIEDDIATVVYGKNDDYEKDVLISDRENIKEYIDSWSPEVGEECLIYSTSNGGWEEGKINSIENDNALIYYGDDLEKEVNIYDRSLLRKKEKETNEIKKELKNENKEEFKNENKEEFKNENKEELKNEIKEEFKNENKEEFKNENKEEFKNENKEELKNENKEKLKNEIKENINLENKIDFNIKNNKEKGELKNDNLEWKPEINEKCYIFSNSNGGWTEGEIVKIEQNIATVYYGDDYEKEVELDDREIIKEFKNESQNEAVNEPINHKLSIKDPELKEFKENTDHNNDKDIKEIKLEIEEKIKKNKKNDKNNNENTPKVIVDKVEKESDIISLENIPLVKYSEDNDDGFTFFKQAPKFF